MKEISDIKIIEKILGGDPRAFSELVDKYKDFAFTVALRVVKNRETAEEVAQDAFVNAYESLGKFDKRAKFSTWFYRVVYNKAVDATRAKKNPLDSSVEIDRRALATAEPTGSTPTELRERDEIIKAAISELDPKSAAAVTFFYYEELPLKDISKIMNLTKSNLKSVLFRARKKLSEILKATLKEEFETVLR